LLAFLIILFLLQVQASSGDFSAISYSISSSTLSQLPITQFQINATTGDVCVTSSLDRETISSYDFEVRATNQVKPFSFLFYKLLTRLYCVLKV